MEHPAFEYIEVVESYVSRKFSLGNGVFHDHRDNVPTEYAFSVFKDLAAGRLDVTIWSPLLRHTLALTEPYVLGLQDLLQRYELLKKTLSTLGDPCLSQHPYENASELRLLVVDLLLDRKVFSGFDLESLYEQGIVSRFHWQDMQLKSTLNDLRVIDEAFQNECNRQDQDLGKVEDDLHLDNDLLFKDDLLFDDDSGRPSPNSGSAEYFPPYSSTAPPAEHILNRSRELLGKVPTMFEDLEHPGSFKEICVWDIGKSCGISIAEQNCLDRLIGNDEVLRELKSLIFSSDRMKASSLPKTKIFFHNQTIAEDSHGAFGSVRSCTLHEKRKFLKRHLHEVFKAEANRFNDEVKDINWEDHTNGSKATTSKLPAACRFITQSYRAAWRKGVAVIRQLLKGRKPETLGQICRLLQVAFAMGSHDPTISDFRTEFANDLHPWRTIVPANSILQFDAIADAVWDMDLADSKVPAEYSPDENLAYIQQLLSGLISSGMSTNFENSDQELRSMPVHEQGLGRSLQVAQQLLSGSEDPRAYPHTRKLPICWEPVDSGTVLMMAGAIFGFVFSFLLLFHAFTSPTLYAKVSSQLNLHFANYEERNVHTLPLYLSLSISSLWIDETDQSKFIPASATWQPQQKVVPASSSHSSSPPMPGLIPSPPYTNTQYSASPQNSSRNNGAERLQCRRCCKKFSNVGNRNRHVRYDCEQRMQFPCRNPGCSMQSTRKAYRDKHEFLTCPYRLLVG
ncbi:hypothetical protein DL95DRAFT_446400 [Leptodontidium sp. 2 PMI_412]|nr:hypothetical protein DL95DRAFT_446400 [Leptodontidium sp. 2 PMI_412]